MSATIFEINQGDGRRKERGRRVKKRGKTRTRGVRWRDSSILVHRRLGLGEMSEGERSRKEEVKRRKTVRGSKMEEASATVQSYC